MSMTFSSLEGNSKEVKFNLYNVYKITVQYAYMTPTAQDKIKRWHGYLE